MLNYVQLAANIKSEVDQYSIASLKDDPRTHLGASIIGHDCAAYCWNTFRWLKQEQFDGRMHRLFNRGHLEEQRFIDWLRGVGFEVHDKDIDGNQFRFADCEDHYGGSLDALLYRYDTGRILGEFKTHNAKSFLKLQDEKVIKSKPQHYKQMCSYGPYYGLEHALYCAANKDTDELYFEMVAIDYTIGEQMKLRAHNIINSQVQPQKISQSAAFFTCKYCHFNGICFKGEAPEKNCRSCINAKPSRNGKWFCMKHKAHIPADFIPQGCDDWYRII